MVWVKSIEIENFKSFYCAQVVDFEPGFNLILGANNAGKSTILQALDLSANPEVPHRSVSNVPLHGVAPPGVPRAKLTVSLSMSELRNLRAGDSWVVPVTEAGGKELASLTHDQRLIRLLAINEMSAALERNPSGMQSVHLSGDIVDGGWNSDPARNDKSFMTLTERLGGQVAVEGPANVSRASQLLRNQLQGLAKSIFKFEPNRTPVQSTSLSVTGQLTANASNLAGCIGWLQSNDIAGHMMLCKWINRVLPHIHTVQSPPLNEGAVQLRCYMRPPSERRDDLAVPIHQMGSGVGNVIATLYVVLTARTSQVICIDEPNQFLHPRALRELLNILATEGGRHQYILTAHAADVISAVVPKTVTVVSLDEGVTRVKQAKRDGILALREGLAELGVRATELHGRDRVLWVEGQTEELVFPALLLVFCKEHAAGTAVLRVHETGAFDRKGIDPIKMVEIYSRLTGIASLAPPMVAVVLDREGRSDAERQRLESDRRGAMRFLPRRMLENFLLHPDAIAAVLRGLGEGSCGKEDVERFLKSQSAGEAPIDLERIDGAKVLAALFNSLSDARHEFRKTREVPAIAEWLLANDVEHLRPLGDWLKVTIGEAL